MASGNDMKAHEGTYAAFTKFATYGTVFVALVAAFVVMLISR